MCRPAFDRDQRHKMLSAEVPPSEPMFVHRLLVRCRHRYVVALWPKHNHRLCHRYITNGNKKSGAVYIFLINLRLLYFFCFNFLSLRAQNDPSNYDFFLKMKRRCFFFAPSIGNTISCERMRSPTVSIHCIVFIRVCIFSSASRYSNVWNSICQKIRAQMLVAVVHPQISLELLFLEAFLIAWAVVVVKYAKMCGALTSRPAPLTDWKEYLISFFFMSDEMIAEANDGRPVMSSKRAQTPSHPNNFQILINYKLYTFGQQKFRVKLQVRHLRINAFTVENYSVEFVTSKTKNETKQRRCIRSIRKKN